ncbi:MAG: long-chain fatty acid--CoA ligase [Sphingomonadales bacterium]|jgi:long-chain acyl-CoA synthetase
MVKSGATKDNTGPNWPNLVTMFFDQAAQFKKKPFLWRKIDGRYRPLAWRDVAADVARMTVALQKLGVSKGDRVAIIAENRPEWLIADFAIMAAGGISVPVYTTYTERDYMHVLGNSGAKGVIVSTRNLIKTVLPVAHQLNTVRFMITMESTHVTQGLNVDIYSWLGLLEDNRRTKTDDIAEQAKKLERHDTACLIYTSGTGGLPRGVMQHHGAILHNVEGADEVLQDFGKGNDSFLSFLPLSHAYEHTGGQFLPIYSGAQIYYAEGIDKLATNLTEARPSIMVVVPRMFEVLRSRISRDVEKAGGLRKKLFDRALELGKKEMLKPGSLNFAEKQYNKLLDRLVRSKVRKRFGGRIKALVSGGAPLNPDIGYFFGGLGLTMLQGYGQTEAAPVIAVHRKDNIKMHTVGPPIKNTEVKIAEDGEILVRGELVMHGYWRDPDSTEATLKDDWLHTGDIGHIDEDGHVVITDRKKDIIVNDKGDNISPQRVEGMLALEPEIMQAMVYGDKRPHMVGLLVPDPEWLKEWAAQNGKGGGDIMGFRNDPDLAKALDAAVSRVNARLSVTEKVRRFIVAKEAFTIENEQMTPTLKIRRHVIKEVYFDELEALYGKG